MNDAKKNPTEKLFQVNLTPAEVDRFWSHVDKSGDCWLWIGGQRPLSYGRFYLKERRKTGLNCVIGAHRIAYFLEFGPFPNSLFCCHKCDNPPCVNPSHIFLGDVKANTSDAARKGRMPRGSKSKFASLKEEDVVRILEMHKLGKTDAEIGRHFNTTRGAVWRIVSGRNWKHLTGGFTKSTRRTGAPSGNKNRLGGFKANLI